MTDLTPDQERELRTFADDQPHRLDRRPNKNLIRRNLLTHAPGTGHYRITEYGRAALAERQRDIR